MLFLNVGFAYIDVASVLEDPTSGAFAKHRSRLYCQVSKADVSHALCILVLSESFVAFAVDVRQTRTVKLLR